MNKNVLNLTSIILVGICVMLFEFPPSVEGWRFVNILIYSVAILIYGSVTFTQMNGNDFLLPTHVGTSLMIFLGIACGLQQLTIHSITRPHDMDTSVLTTLMLLIVFGVLSNTYLRKNQFETNES